jgi:N-acetylglucosaminyldiphosphoundecaprenol N-acetyl-beta-D-mannosaminyltransferase
VRSVITDELIDMMAEKCLLNDRDFDAAVLDVRPKRIQTVNLHHLAASAPTTSRPTAGRSSR